MTQPFCKHTMLAGAIAVAALLPSIAQTEIQPEDIDPEGIVLTHPDMPALGTTKEAVREQLGAPENRVPPVGDPPISSWIYDEFIVYFEHDRVLHSVIPGGQRQTGGER